MRPEEALRLVQSSLIDEKTFSGLQRHLAEVGKMKFVIASRSMEPCIHVSDTVEIVAPTNPLKRFDIVVYWSGKQLVCHVFWHANSLAWEGPSLFVAKGLDPSLGEDLPVPKHRILGRVVSHRLGWRDKWGLLRRAWLRNLRN